MLLAVGQGGAVAQLTNEAAPGKTPGCLLLQHSLWDEHGIGFQINTGFSGDADLKKRLGMAPLISA